MQLIIYSDGSARPNPGAGGWGLFGYLASPAVTKGFKKHPSKALRYTDEGLLSEKDKASAKAVEVEEIIELIGHPVGNATNNFCELQGFIEAVELAVSYIGENKPLKKVLVITDSRYVVEGFSKHLKGWTKNGWKKRDGQVIANLSRWQHLNDLASKLAEHNCQIKAKWVEGHSTSYGNEMADYFSVIGSSIASDSKVVEATGEVCRDYFYRDTLANFKKSFADKEATLRFNELFYSPKFQDSKVDYYFDQVEEDGKTALTTDVLFTLHKGEAPLLVKKVKAFLNEFGHPTASYSVKLSRLASPDKLRLLDHIDFKHVVTVLTRDSWSFCRDSSACITRYTPSHQLLLTAEKIFFDIENDFAQAVRFDLTETLFKDGKLQTKNSEQFLNVTNFIQGDVPSYLASYQLPVMCMGSEIPKYLVLNQLAKTHRCELFINIDEYQAVMHLGMVFTDMETGEILISRNGTRCRLIKST